MKKIKTTAAAISALSLLFLSALFVSCDDGGSTGKSDGAENNKQETAQDSESKVDSYDDSALSSATLWVVGDSTVCDYGDYVKDSSASITDSTYFYPRYGYGMQLYNYLSEKITVKNLALSGRSSKSFISEDNYTVLKNGIKAGDFLVIGFGHNDEKSDDADRFSSASESSETEGSFKYNLYNYYAKLALDAGATPVLCSPICRLNSKDDYSGSYAHITDTGDYGASVVELGSEKNIQVVDLTSITKELYTALGYDEAIYFHAMSSGSSDTEPKLTSVDTTHINVYGAKRVSYEFAKVISSSSCALSPYVDTSKLTEPSKDSDLIKNPNFKYVEYEAVDWSSYEPVDNFKTTTVGWYGTAFGDTGGAPATASNGFYATETSSGVFKVGQTGTSSPKGKIASSSEGYAFCFKPVSVNDNFTITVTATVLTTAGVKQAGFGLMLRDDCYVPLNDKSILSNYVAAGVYAASDSGCIVNFCRESSSLKQETGNAVSGLYAADDTATFTITRTGQVVKVKTVYKSETYETTYTDFDFVAKDSDYMYVGAFATRGTTIEVTDVTYTKTGESQGA